MSKKGRSLFGFFTASFLSLSLFGIVSPAFGQVTISVDAPSTVQFGMGLRYLIQVTNNGGSAATGLVVTDTLPAGVSATSFPSNCAGTATVICDVGTLGAGQTTTVPIEVVPLTGPATLVNSASVTGGSSASASTDVISNGVALAVLVNSSNASDVVTSSPAGLTCSGLASIKYRCFTFFPIGSTVTLSASSPNFAGWITSGGSCPGTGPCTLTMSQELLVVANYTSPVGFTDSSFNITGVVNLPFGIELSNAAIGGTPPYTFSITNGTLPAGVAASGLRISGTPTATGTFPITLQVQDSSSPTPGTASISGNITIINAPNTQASLLNGKYALLLRGVSDANASERAFVGTFTFDGAGSVSGTLERNCNSGCSGTTFDVTGSYSIGADNRGLINLSANGGTLTFAMAVGEVSSGVASRARIIRFDDTTGTTLRAAGELRLQNPAAFTTTSMAGTYVFGLTGEDPSRNRVVEAGLFSTNSAGGVSGGTVDVNDNGVPSSSAFAGTYAAPDATGRTTLTLNLANGGTSSVVAYVIDADDLYLMTLDPGTTNPVVAGTGRRQTNPGSFGTASLAGPDVISVEGLSGSVNSSNSEVFLGVLTASSAGGPPTASVTFDSNDNRIVQIQGTESGSYSVASNGRGTLNLATPGPLIAYLADADQGYVMATGVDPGFGEIALQTGGPFSNASFAGSYFSGDREPASPSGGPVTSGSGFVQGCTATFTIDESHTRGELDYGLQLSTGFALFPSGRATSTFALGNLVSYLVSPSRMVSAAVDPGEHHPHITDGFATSLTPGRALVSIVVSPSGTTIGAGQTQQYTATGIYNDQSTQDLTTRVNWVSSNLGVATIGPAGLATAAAVGTANILAAFGCISSAPVTLTVATGTIVVKKVSNPNPDPTNSTFGFTAGGGLSPSAFSLANGGTQTFGNLAPGAGYSISETTPNNGQTGWAVSLSCTSALGTSSRTITGNSVSINIAAGDTMTCTFTNATAFVKVTKTLNGGPIPAGACGTGNNVINPCAFSFQLRSGASGVAAGTILETEVANAGNGGVLNFATRLIPGQQYEMCEQLLPGWLTTLGPPLYSVFNPSADNSVVCTNFTPTAGQTVPFAISNQPPPGGMALGIGFWKNWASCAASQGKQQPVLDRTLASFPGGGVYVGNLFVNTCQIAVSILSKSTANGTKAANSPAYNLAAQLLAVRLNMQAGAGSNGCLANDATWANDILSPVKDALGNMGIDFAKAFISNNQSPTMTSIEVTDANYLQTQLDNYNNNLAVQCSTTYQFD